MPWELNISLNFIIYLSFLFVGLENEIAEQIGVARKTRAFPSDHQTMILVLWTVILLESNFFINHIRPVVGALLNVGCELIVSLIAKLSQLGLVQTRKFIH